MAVGAFAVGAVAVGAVAVGAVAGGAVAGGAVAVGAAVAGSLFVVSVLVTTGASAFEASTGGAGSISFRSRNTSPNINFHSPAASRRVTNRFVTLTISTVISETVSFSPTFNRSVLPVPLFLNQANQTSSFAMAADSKVNDALSS